MKNRLYPIEGTTSKKFYCPLTRDLYNLVEEAEFINPPKVVIVHCGTNDLDHTDSITVVNNIAHSIQKLSSKLISSKIIVSGLLPRRDYTNKDIYNINLEVSKKFQLASNVHFVEHKNLLIDELSSILLDKKHLNESGIETFSKNLKDGIFGRLNIPTTFRRPTSPPRMKKYEFLEKSGAYSGNRRMMFNSMKVKGFTNMIEKLTTVLYLKVCHHE